MQPTASPFEREAIDYDEVFTQGSIGSTMRAAVWRRLDVCFNPGSYILELGCGTGEDAVHLAKRGVFVVATDPTASMLRIAQSKVDAAKLADQIQLRQLEWEDLATDKPLGQAIAGHATPEPAAQSDDAGALFDGALSNFGALNCVADLAAASRGLASTLRPGAVAVLCVMGPLVPWEWLWLLSHGQPRSALRRLSPRGAMWRGLRVRYPSIRTLRRAFAPDFRLRRVAAVGALVPPSYAETWAVRHPNLLRRLDLWERRAETWFPLPWLADHYLAELVRLG
ncbi:MAG: class I SAM-dependent methyltransferase [Acidobacteriota bacterium]